MAFKYYYNIIINEYNDSQLLFFIFLRTKPVWRFIQPDNRFMEQFPILYDAHTMVNKLMDFI